MTLLTQVDSRNAYLQVHSESDCENPGELESQTTHYPCPPRMIQLFQAALWCLAGSALVGFAVSVLWWDPVCPGPQVSHSNPVRYNSTKARLDQARFDSWKKAHRKGKDECDPFHEQGYLHFNATDPGDNTWRPYRPDCKPSNLFEQLKQDLHFTTPTFGRNQNDRFNWLRNRTVVLIGDSIDRYHNLDFCNVLSWETGSTEEDPKISENRPTRTYYIGADSPLSPPAWHFYPENPLRPPDDWPADERELFEYQTPIWDSGKINANTTRPRVCEIPKYGFTVISLFTWGLDPKEGGRLYANISGYFPPAEYTSRIENILNPVLTNLAKHLKNPLITKPDLVEMSSGFWDLRQWSEEDIKVARKLTKVDPKEIGFNDLGSERLAWWTERQKKAIEFVSKNFPQPETPILWRTLHHVQRHYWVGYNRVYQLDQLARYNIERMKENDPSLRSRLRLDEWGALMLGQEHRFRDVMHVRELPGGVLWGDIMLWELRRAVTKRGLKHYIP